MSAAASASWGHVSTRGATWVGRKGHTDWAHGQCLLAMNAAPGCAGATMIKVLIQTPMGASEKPRGHKVPL